MKWCRGSEIIPHEIPFLHADKKQSEPYYCFGKSTVIHQDICNMYYLDVIMGAISSQITSLAIVYSAVNSGPGQRKHQSSASLAYVLWIHQWPVNSPHKWQVTQKMFPFNDVIKRRYISENTQISVVVVEHYRVVVLLRDFVMDLCEHFTQAPQSYFTRGLEN